MVMDSVPNKQNTIIKADTEPTNTPIDNNDTINISTIPGDPLTYTQSELKQIQKQYPELTKGSPLTPDITYYLSESKGYKTDYKILGCEACKDGYYSLYAYFLKPRNGGEKYASQRETLVRLYRDINEIFSQLKHGGTYFGHQYTRILAYAEYSVYEYDYEVKNDELKKYDVSGQKKQYINLLKKHISDEIDDDPESAPFQKTKFKKQLFETVKDIDRLITEYFYLEKVQEFQYSHY